MRAHNVSSFSCQAMGCVWEIDIYDSISEPLEIEHSISKYLSDFENTYSRFLPSSLVSQLRQVTGVVEFPPEGVDMIRCGLELSEASGGLFHLGLATQLEELGYDSSYSLVPQKSRSAIRSFHECVRVLDQTHIDISTPVSLDFGSLGKGRAIDGLVELLKTCGCESVVVNGSGDMRHVGSGSLRVGLEHPLDQTRAIGDIELSDMAIAGSSRNRRSWRGVHHIVHPFECESPEYILATWVVAKSAMHADALATALFLCHPDQLNNVCSYEYVMVNKDLQYVSSPGWKGTLF